MNKLHQGLYTPLLKWSILELKTVAVAVLKLNHSALPVSYNLYDKMIHFNDTTELNKVF